jgi:molecular chaperone DnaJ
MGGADLEVPTLHGPVSLKIPAGTQSGEMFKIRAKGIKRLNGNGTGDQVVRVIVEIPENSTPSSVNFSKSWRRLAPRRKSCG